MPNNIISISVDNYKYSGWKAITIEKSLETLSSSFKFVSTDKDNQKNNEDWKLYPQKECIIRLDDIKLITGYIDSVIPTISKDTHSITVSGRDKTSDLIDCM